MSKRKTTEEFILEAKAIHGDKYDYSLVEYIGNRTKVKIFCLGCNSIFEQIPSNHLYGKGCSYCSSLSMDIHSFIKEANIIHNNYYDYSKVKYINKRTEVSIICPEHGEFIQKPENHLKYRCKKCYHDSLRVDKKELINVLNIIHNFKYDYSKLVFNTIRDIGIIICPEHGEFNQSVSAHQSGSGCKDCMKVNFSSTTEEFIEKAKKIHGDRYLYNNTIYTKAHNNLIITCKIHGDFEIIATNHINISIKRGCQKCAYTIRKTENDWLDIIGLDINDRQILINGFLVDGFDKNLNTIYEFYGDYWHGNPDIYNLLDLNKTVGETFGELYKKTIDREEKLKSLGYTIVSIWESDYKKQLKENANRS